MSFTHTVLDPLPHSRVIRAGDMQTASTCYGCVQKTPVCHRTCLKVGFDEPLEPEPSIIPTIPEKGSLVTSNDIAKRLGINYATVRSRLADEGIVPVAKTRAIGNRVLVALYDFEGQGLDRLANGLQRLAGTLSVPEAAKEKGITAAGVLNWIKAGHLRAKRHGPHGYRIKPEDLDGIDVIPKDWAKGKKKAEILKGARGK